MATSDKTKVLRLEITISAPDGVTDERVLLNRALKVATTCPADKAITFADALETVDLAAVDVRGVTVGGEAPDFDAVMDTARRWYYAGIRRMVDSIIEDMNEQKPDNREEWLTDRLHEDCDGHSFVTYTAQSQMAIAASDNADAYDDAGFGEDQHATDAQRCYYAMEADARQLLNARRDEWDIDPDDEDDDSDDE